MDQNLSCVEELTLCSFCKEKFNNTDLCPKMLQCKHYFCLKCIETTMIKGRELYCIHCWKRTEIPDEGAPGLATHTPILSLTRLSFLQGDKNLDNKDVKQGNDVCHLHVRPTSMWCQTCHKSLCEVCITRSEHHGHQVMSENEAKDILVNEVQIELSAMNKILMDIERLSVYQREFLLKVLEACVTLKTCLETDLQMSTTPELTEAKEIVMKAKVGLLQFSTPAVAQNFVTNLVAEKQRLEAKYHEMLLQCKLEDLIGSSGVLLDFQLLTHLPNIQNNEFIFARSNAGIPNPILFLTNYCMSQLYSRYVISKSQNQQDLLQPKINQNNDYFFNKLYFLNDNMKTDIVLQNGGYHGKSNDYIPTKINVPEMNLIKSKYEQSPPISIIRNPSNSYPLYFLNIDLDSTYLGRIVIETRPDVAPKMSKNFAALCTGETGVSYKNCTIFQCWGGESIITGDYETNNGRGGRSIYEEGYFMPDETKIPSVRGAVGMRRTQKRHDNLGMVGSQFRVILQEMRSFTAIFGHVVEGIDVIEKIASFGDSTGKPTKTITINNCGKL
ncbi:UNVERIFIED_CONTAM: hypothetical protein PYX00_001033 [Menopon gallinae]|uniref:Peptidyl-prolyl cis-trans isomerase n=1 Tax=Menopon gallinae TaxID=328185 RepID=A0AAW2IDB1_9NEOP